MSKADKMLFDLGYETTETDWGELIIVRGKFERIRISNGYNDDISICKLDCGESAPFTLEEFIAVNEKLKEAGYIK